MENILKAYNSLRAKTDFRPLIGIVLGSGLGGFADSVRQTAVVPYSEIEGFPVSTVSGHKGRFVFGYIGEVPVVVMQGRVHYYEGYSMREVVLPVRVMAKLGIRALLLSNAAGGINRAFPKGTLMALTDHICMAPNPLIGENLSEFGTRFPDMTDCYDPEILNALRSAAAEENIALQEGVYYQTSGPSFETPAEINMMRVMGADAVGMSTAVEAIAARHAGVRVGCVSAISNAAAGIDGPLSHEDVSSASEIYGESFTRLLKAAVLNIANLPGIKQ